MKKSVRLANTLAALALLQAVLLGSLAGVARAAAPSPAQETAPCGEELSADERQIRSVVETFGKRLRKVPISGSAEIAAAGITRHYAGLVTPKLLEAWLAAPLEAPGRLTSSPWPDRIIIAKVEIDGSNGSDRAVVLGDVLEITGVELLRGGTAAKRPITLTMEKIDGRWLIGAVELGAYTVYGPVFRECSPYGCRFSPPALWQDRLGAKAPREEAS